MQVIINALGNVIQTLTQFFSYIAPGYLGFILSIFIALIPYTIFKLLKKMVMSHA